MVNTTDILAHIESMTARDTARAGQSAAPAGVAANNGAAEGSIPRAGGLPGEADPQGVNARVPGVAFVATVTDAKSKGWPVQGAHPEGRAGQFVYERPDNTGFHRFLQPAELPPEFHVRSTLLESTEVEDWRSDMPTTGDPSVFPNLDVILANAKGSPMEFVQAVVDQGWATNSSAVGMLAQVVHQHIQRPGVQQRLEQQAASRKILIFDALLSFAQLDEGRKSDTFWFGCPVFPSQLLAVIQRKVANQPGSAWQAPPLDRTVAIIGQVAQITDQARDLATSIVLNKSADWSEVRKLAAQGEEMKEAVQLFTSLSWEEACHAAKSPDLPTTLQLLQQRERRMTLAEGSHPDRQGEGWSLPITATGRPGTPTFFLAREPGEGEPKLTPAEREELEEACKAQATTSITIEKARLLAESTGVAIIALQPGGPDISRVNMPYYAENLLRNVQEEIATCDSLRKVPLVTLAKVFSLRMTQNDNFVFEHLGLLVAEDFSTEVTLTKMRGATQGTHIIKARKHRWAAINTMEDLAHVVDGLVLCVKRFHHESVCSHQEISELWAKLRTLYVSQGGHAHITGLFRVFKTRIEEHALAVRTRSQGEATTLPPLSQLQSRSLVIYNQVCEAAKQQCLRDYVALRSGPGETAWGAYRRGADTIDADGKKGVHSGPAQSRAEANRPPQAERTRGDLSASAGPTSKRLTSQDEQQGMPRNAQKKPRKTTGAGPPCVRCAKPGHNWHECANKEWCAIPESWPGYLKSLAARVRADKGVGIFYDQRPPRGAGEVTRD